MLIELKEQLILALSMMQLGLYLTMEERTQIGYMLKMKLKRLSKWGFKNAEKLSDVILNENQLTNDGFYISQKFWIKMQCIVEN